MLLLAACTQHQERKTQAVYSLDNNQSPADEITCWGIGDIDLDNDESSLAEKVGKENLVRDSLILGGSFERVVTKVWKGENKEVIVHWTEKKPPFSTIDFLEISQPHSPYHFVNGIKIGSRLSEMVKLNGDIPITLYGFGGDNGGAFVDFGKGKLAGDIPCFGGVFTLPQSVGPDDMKGIQGDKKMTSDNSSLKKYDPTLAVIRVHN